MRQALLLLLIGVANGTVTKALGLLRRAALCIRAAAALPG